VRYIVVETEYCKGCGLCLSVCPKHVIALSEEINSRGYHTALLTDAENCTGCCFCAQVCPDAALEVYLAKDEARYDDDNDD
jgi:2-oxoglutarate ferredoxin oxidoreductase subunit delta